MSDSDLIDTNQLIERVVQGDDEARNQLLDRYRQKLRAMIALRMDARLRSRIDASDVVQESLVEANAKLAEYADKKPVPFYVWLRALALNRLADLHRQHVRAQRRSVQREEKQPAPLPDESVQQLAQLLIAGGSSPSSHAYRQELHRKVKEALNLLSENDREMIILRHLEQLKVKEIASVLGITETAAKVRHVRALERLRQALGSDFEELL